MRLRVWLEQSTKNTESRFMLFCAVAAIFYTFRLGSWSLGASEAYSALAASQGSVAGTIQEALRFDPGKLPFYHVLLHSFVKLFGNNETTLRGFSAIFALASLLPLFSLGCSMFASETALAAVAIWAVNPIALFLGQWARMYSLFIATALMSMLSFWKVREQTSTWRVAAFALCTALMLYTHLCGLLFVGAELAVLTRDFQQRRSVRGACAGLAAAFILFMPVVPCEAGQARALLFGHWLDWIGTAHFSWCLSKALTLLTALAVMLVLVFGAPFETDQREPIRFCSIWLITPILVLTAISIIVRPVFAPRYVSPGIPALGLLLARGVEVFGPKARNLSTAGIVTAFVVLFLFCKAARYEPWLDIARDVASASAKEPVFFESPLGARKVRGAAELNEQFDTDFPQGFLKVPFDYYFRGANPRRVVNPFEPSRARQELRSAALQAGGAWLVSGSSDQIAAAEMPQVAGCRVTRVLHAGETNLYHVVAITPRECRNDGSPDGDSGEVDRRGIKIPSERGFSSCESDLAQEGRSRNGLGS
jgi:hypothetical protein